jgi:hypothetical protein
METIYRVGQTLRLRKLKKRLWEQEDYYVVLGYNDNNLWIQAIKDNVFFKSGFSFIPETLAIFDPVEIFGYQLLNTKGRIKENYTQDIICDMISFVDELDSVVAFNETEGGLESNIYFGMGNKQYPEAKGKLFVEFPPIFNQ